MKRLIAALSLSFAGSAVAAEGFGSFSIVIKAGGFEERCVYLAAGEAMHYAFRVDAPVDFNIHFHAGKNVHYPVRQKLVREASGTFRAERTEGYCLMWENGSKQSVVVDGELEPAAR